MKSNARVIKSKDPVLKEIETSMDNKISPTREFRERHESLSDRLASDKYHIINYYVPGAEKFFEGKELEKYRRVSKYYPQAKGGPLHIDEPRFDSEKEICEKKSVMMSTLGLKYIIIDRDISEEEMLERFS